MKEVSAWQEVGSIIVLMGVSGFLGWALGGVVGLAVGIAAFFGLTLLLRIRLDIVELREGIEFRESIRKNSSK
jgi:hypothetical protein